MNQQNLQILGTIILIAGLALGSIGTHRIVTNISISDEEPAASRRGESLRGNV